MDFYSISQVRVNKLIIKTFQSSFPKSGFSNSGFMFMMLSISKKIKQLFTAFAIEY